MSAMSLEGHFCWEACDEGPHGCICGNDCDGDDREALAAIVKQVSQKFGGPSMTEFANDPPIRKHYATADAIISAGFKR